MYYHKKIYLYILIVTFSAAQIMAQVDGALKRYVRVGALQSHFTAYGSERAWNNSYYEGLIWPALYPMQDNAVIKRTWIAAKDFTDADGRHWGHYAIYFAMDYVGQSLFPMELKQIAKFKPPTVYVDGVDLYSIYLNQIDEVNPDIIPDRIIVNVVNTSLGLTMTRKIYVFSQQYHDNYFIKEFTFTNTGNTDYDPEIELSDTLRGVRIGWGTRYSVCREGAYKIGDGQSWGKHTWVTRRGEDFASHAGEAITLANPIVDWLRCGFSWAGQSSRNAYDNLGAPDLSGDGRLCAPQHAGLVVLHVDRSIDDKRDDPNQPVFLGWHAGDTYPRIGNLQPSDEPKMAQVYDMLAGNPFQGQGGIDRMDETYGASNADPFTVHNDAGGTNIMITYGPFDIPPGESITIVEAEGVNGISRTLCEQIGRRWKKAHDNSSDQGPFVLPNGSQTNNEDIYKDTWVATGKDSILLTFSRAKRNYDSGYELPQPPLPPTLFNVQSGGDRIFLNWLPSPSETDANFGGYRLYRATGRPDTTYQEIFACGKGTDNPDLVYEYADRTAQRGQSYYYYIVAFSDGSLNQTEINPHGELHSSMYYTLTTEPAYLQRPAGQALSDIRVVPNPFQIKNRNIQYVGEPNKIMFLNIPGECTIKIFTERGDLVSTIEHTNGSGDESWNLVSDSHQLVVSGIYLAFFQTPEGKSTYRKFIVIR